MGHPFSHRSAITISVHGFEGTKSLGARMTDLMVLLLGAVLGVAGTLVAYAIADALLQRRHRKHHPKSKGL